MSMLLTIPPTTTTEFGGRHPHDFHTRDPPPPLRYSPRFKHEHSLKTLPDSVNEHPRHGIMSNPHRGLPPPSAMALPEPARQSGPMLSQSLGPMPAPPPNQWHGQEDSMRNWLSAKTEEDKRKQEEEKTRQETLRLEQRRIEQSMLRESLQGGIPPQMVPMIYAGIGGANLANVSLDWLNQYSAQLQAAQQQQVHQAQQASPEQKRDTRMLGQSQTQFAAPHTQAQAAQAQQGAPLQTTFSAYPSGPSSPGARARQLSTSGPRPATHKALPRLTTNEMHINQPPQAGVGAHPLQQSQTVQQESSPSIYFHHWVPPNESKSNSGGKHSTKEEAPSSAHPGSQRSDNDYKESPRKRKAQGGHQSNPPPSSAGAQHTSPSFAAMSTGPGRRQGHARSQSNPSAEKDEAPGRVGSQREGQDERRVREMSNQHFERPGRPSTEADRSRDEARR